MLSHLLVFASSLLAVAWGQTLCGETGSFSSGDYIYVPNAWGESTGSGFQCIDVSGAQNNGSSFSATWSWAANASAVHSYPSIKLNTDILPVQLSNVQSFPVSVEWTMGMTDPSDSLNSSLVVADVVFDLFASQDAGTSLNSTEAEIEIMIWIGSFGQPHPSGYSNGSTGSLKLGGITYELYTGTGQNGQSIYSWLAFSNLVTYKMDVLPLLTYLTTKDLIDSSVYVGDVTFGTEAFHSPGNVTFGASNVTLALETYAPPANSTASATATSTSTSTIATSESTTSPTPAIAGEWVRRSSGSHMTRPSMRLLLLSMSLILAAPLWRR